MATEGDDAEGSCIGDFIDIRCATQDAARHRLQRHFGHLRRSTGSGADQCHMPTCADKMGRQEGESQQKTGAQSAGKSPHRPPTMAIEGGPDVGALGKPQGLA